MVSMHLFLPIEQRELKGVSSFEKNRNVFQRDKYYTSLLFSEWKKRIYGIEGGWEGKSPLNKHLSFVKQFYQSGVRCGPWVYLWQ